MKQQLQLKREMKDKEKTLVGTDALKATPVSEPMNSCGSKDCLIETPSRSWKFQNYEKRNLTRMKGNEE